MRKTLAWILLPLTMWYPIGVALRNLLFDLGLLRSTTPPLPTLGLGNLACGGTGKTPHAEYFLRQVPGSALLSRGYRRQSQGYHTAHEGGDLCALLGDEPAMVAHHLPGRTVAVCESRREGLRRLAEEEKRPTLVVMDDCMQHRWVRPHRLLLLTEYGHLYCHDRVLPWGNLREGRRGRRRADAIVVTKCPEVLSASEMEAMRRQLRPLPHQRVYFSCLAYSLPSQLPPRVTLLTGIAHPEPLVRRLEGLTQVELHRFADHHPFTQRELDALPPLPILTTEKDLERLRRLDLRGRSLSAVPVEVRFLGEAPQPL